MCCWVSSLTTVNGKSRYLDAVNVHVQKKINTSTNVRGDENKMRGHAESATQAEVQCNHCRIPGVTNLSEPGYTVIESATNLLHCPDIMCYLSLLWYIILYYTNLNEHTNHVHLSQKWSTMTLWKSKKTINKTLTFSNLFKCQCQCYAVSFPPGRWKRKPCAQTHRWFTIGITHLTIVLQRIWNIAHDRRPSGESWGPSGRPGAHGHCVGDPSAPEVNKQKQFGVGELKEIINEWIKYLHENIHADIWNSL